MKLCNVIRLQDESSHKCSIKDIIGINTCYQDLLFCQMFFVLFPRAKFRCKMQELDYSEDPLVFKWPGIGKHCLYMFLEFIGYFLITLLIEVCSLLLVKVSGW